MAKTRVHELAKTYGIESKEVLEKLKEMGEFVKSPSSTIELPVEMKFKKQYGDALLATKATEAPAAKPAEKAAEAKPAAAAAPAEAPAPAPRRCRDRRAGRARGRGARRQGGTQARSPHRHARGTGCGGRRPGGGSARRSRGSGPSGRR